MVGHTHEDIDQMFSCISKEAHRKSAVTVDDLHELIRESFSPTPETRHLNNIWDFRNMTNVGINLAGMKEPHIFKLAKRDGKVHLSYKDWPVPNEEYR